MNISEPKLHALQDQVNSKIYWDEPQESVAEWLKEKHGLPEDRIAAMIAKAWRQRRKEIRERAFYGLIFSAVGMSIPGTYLAMQWSAQQFPLWETAWVTLMSCFAAFLKALARLLSGETDATVDH